MKISSAAVALLVGASTVSANCPYMNKDGGLDDASMNKENVLRHFSRRQLNPNERVGDGGIPEGGFAAVAADIDALLTDSQASFPADFSSPDGPHYGGLFVRLAWHCAGSYRETDGRGGCDGGRIRFDPELNWADNANLDNALMLLEPIKEKYGSSLSWGDLIILAGTQAIKNMRGPVLGFCGGRIDDPDGSDSILLGPSPEQEELAPCQSIGMQGMCEEPLGPSTVELIYVNPAGPVGFEGNTMASAADIRNIFGRMGFNDTEIVGLVGGGHAFGKCHGACMDPPCGEEGTPLFGVGPNTFTSGFEGQWTTRPTTWDNEFFKNLFNLEWEAITGPGGNLQFSNGGIQDTIMLTADLAFRDDELFRPIATMFADNLDALDFYFARTWYQLTSGDMGPADRCIGDMVPEPLEFQRPLPPAPESFPITLFVKARKIIMKLVKKNSYLVPEFTRLTFNCARTFRETDFRGGCNGARIRFEPESEFDGNEGLEPAIKILEAIQKKRFFERNGLSLADLIVLAGQTAIEYAGGNAMPFCAGRVDADDAGRGAERLAPRTHPNPVVEVRDDIQVKGLLPEEGVALFARPAGERTVLSNQYFVDLMNGNGAFSPQEQALLAPEFLPLVQLFADDKEEFLKVFAQAWTKLVTADRYDGPFANVCDGVSDPTLLNDIFVDDEDDEDSSDSSDSSDSTD